MKSCFTWNSLSRSRNRSVKGFIFSFTLKKTKTRKRLSAACDFKKVLTKEVHIFFCVNVSNLHTLLLAHQERLTTVY